MYICKKYNNPSLYNFKCFIQIFSYLFDSSSVTFLDQLRLKMR